MTTLEEIRNSISPSVRYGWLNRGPCGFEKERNYLKLILKSVVLGDEEGKKMSNSVIIFGPPGSGKTSFVESAIAELSESEHKGKSKFYKHRRVVRLNGTICTDFKTAIEEICWQLKFTGFDDTESKENVHDFFEKLTSGGATFDDRLEQTLIYLKSNLLKLQRSIIFILDQLELFAEQPNQGLLYNLFDLAATNNSVPICIIGITSRVDVLELFEKRVKSRFSHRQINLVGGLTELEDYTNAAAEMLLHWKDEKWNKDIHALLKNKELIRILKYIYDTDKSIGKLSVFLYNVCLISDENQIKISDFQQGYDQMFFTSGHVQIALDLSVNEILVLLSIYKQIQNNTQQAWQPMNLYKITEKIAVKFSMLKEDFMQVIRKLQTLELITPASNTNRSANYNINAETFFKCEITFPEFQEIWSNYTPLPSSFQELL